MSSPYFGSMSPYISMKKGSINSIISTPGTIGANQTIESFQKEFRKIKSNTIRKEVLYLFNNPDKLLGACMSCRYTGIMILKPVLQVTVNKGAKSVFIKGECYHPDLPQCVGKISKLIARDTKNRKI